MNWWSLLLLLGGLWLQTEALVASGSTQGPFLVDLEAPDVIYESQKITFNCSADGVGVVDSYTWWLNDTVQQSGSSAQLVVMVMLGWNQSCLTCGVEGGGMAANASRTLAVYSRSPTLVEYPGSHSQTVTAGSPLVLTCRVLGLPTPTLFWERTGILVSGLQPESVVLNISQVSSDDAGNYTCMVRGMGAFPAVTVRVLFGATITAAPESLDVLNATTAVLQCTAEGDPAPIITWEHNGILVDTSDGRLEVLANGSLLIDPVMLTDMGSYQCRANNSLGADDSNMAMLMVDVFPRFLEHPSDVTETLDNPAVLECVAFGIPEVDYTWQRGLGSNIVAVRLDNRVLEQNGTLTITMTTRDDADSYRCVASNERGSITSPPAVLTIRAPPLAPNNLRVMARGSSWVLLLWDADDATPPIDGYTLEYRLEFEANWTEDIISPAIPLRNMTGLYPSGAYEFRVTASSALGSSQTSDVLEVTTSAGTPVAGLLDAPEDVVLFSIVSRQLAVMWAIPEVLLQTSFVATVLRVSDPNGVLVYANMTNDSLITVSNLTPATSYSISLTILFVGGGEGTAVVERATTRDGVPEDAPTRLNVLATGPRTLTLAWAPPNTPNGNITGYTIYYSPPHPNVTVSTVTSPHVLTSLTPHTLYTIRVAARTSAGEGPQGRLLASTDQDVAPAPIGVAVAPLNSTAIVVSWEQFAGGTVPGVLVNFTILYNQRHHGGHIRQLQAGPNDSHVVLGGLLPYTEYCVRVRAATEAGLGPTTEKLQTRTLGDVPTAMVVDLVVREMCPTGGLSLQWTPPNVGKLGGPAEEVEYVLNYSFRSRPSLSISFPYNSSLNGFVLEDVMPFTNYILWLALQNENGTGPSTHANATSCDAAAPPPTVMTRAISSSSVEVTWVAPPTIPGELIGYVLRYNDMQVNISVNASLHVIEGLTPFTNYSVHMATRTRGPLGAFSAVSTVLTLSAAPVEPVQGVAVVAMCPANLLVQWNEPRPLTAPPDQTWYLVSYNSSDADTANVTVPFSQGPMANLTDLLLGTLYSVVVGVVNSHGAGPVVSVSMNTSREGAATPPNVTVTAANSSVLEVAWSDGRPASLVPPAYTVRYSRTGMDQRSISPSSQSVQLTGLDPFTNYSIVVVANTLCGRAESPVVTMATTEALPTSPMNLQVVAALPTKVKVQWNSPSYANGIITHYNVRCGDALPVSVRGALCFECSGLSSQTRHLITVSAENGAGEGPAISTSANTTCTPTTRAQERGVFSLALPCPASTAYLLVLVQALVSYPDNRHDPPARFIEDYSLEELLMLTQQYKQQVNNRMRRQALNEGGVVYIAANLTEEEFRAGFMLGDNERDENFVNHPLLPGIFYNVTLRGAVLDTDTPIYFTSNTPISVAVAVTEGRTESPSLPLIPIAAGAGAVLLLILFICMAALISCVCCCCNRSLDKVDGVTGLRIERTGSFRMSKKKMLDPVDDFRAANRTEVMEDHPPVPVMGFINKLMVMRTNDNQLFLEEFGSIPMTVPLSTDVANQPANKAKNRYYNILPYDATRVKLKNGDYINACYCSGYRKTKAYIATQGPVPETVGDFWRMVWEENVRTIVMLTNTQEKGKIKCEMYWPREVGSSSQHGNLDICLTHVTTLADYSIRKFALNKGNSSKEPREVVQFHFTSWPDHGVPAYATAMLSLLRRVRSHYSLEEGPMVVHCSAGVGRTGTFIVIDTMLQRLAHEEEMLDIYGHVSLLRSQRNYMIQTEDQYFFVHEAVAEALLCGNTEVPVDDLTGYVEVLCSVIPDDESETTNLELQFKRLALERNDPHRWNTANKNANKTKNRFVNVLPYDSSRVCLEYSPGVEGSDYINASHVDSYHSRRAFIATQGPLANTVEDFWRMLWQYSVPVVVMLTEEVEKGRECSAGYWPGAILHPIKYGKLNVELNVERNSGSYSYRDLSVTNTQTNQNRLVRQFQFHGWPEVGVPSTTMLIEFIREVQKLCQSLPSSHGPIVVHCSNGVGRTGVFISLHIIIERMLVEGVVDVFQTVKNLRIQRPAMVQMLEQYHFCYDAAVTFLQSAEFLPPVTTQSQPTRQRGSSIRGSVRGSSSRHSSVDSRRKGKTQSPSPSPAHSASQRNTPMRSDSFKESPQRTELNSSGPGTGNAAQVYGGSEATSTFGSHSATPIPVAMEDCSHLPGVQLQSDGSNHIPLQTVATPVGTAPLPMPTAGPSTPIPAGSVPNVGLQGSSTPVMAASVPAAASNGQAHGSGVGLSGPPLPGTPVLSGTPSSPLKGPVYPMQTSTPTAAHIPIAPPTSAYHTPAPGAQTPVMGNASTPGALPGHYSPSPTPGGLEMTLQAYTGSQSSMYTASQAGFGSQTLSMFSGSQTPPMSHVSLSPHNSQPGGYSSHTAPHYHQLLETHTHNSLPDRAGGAESTPL